MRVVLGMATDALHRRLDLFGRRLVARITLNRTVRAEKGKARHFVMVKRRFGPGIGGVAILTLAPIVARVAVILLVAGVAGRFRFRFGIPRAMATGTGNGGVFSGQGEYGVGVVVEGRVFPTGGRMAFGAIGAACAICACRPSCDSRCRSSPV